MFRVIFAALLTAGVASQAAAIEVGSPACKRELQAMRQKMKDSLALIDNVKDAPSEAKCPAYSNASNLAEEIRETAARCEDPKVRTSALRDADDVIEAIGKSFNKWCPPWPGMVRVNITMVERITRDKLPKPLAAVHRCATDATMYSSNVRFDLGRLVTLGCSGNAKATIEQIKARNSTSEEFGKEQVALYVTRDKDGDDPRRLTFPIIAADGGAATTDLLVGGRTNVGEKLDQISAFWETAKDGACRIHAIWRVAEGKASLVYWGEASDCAPGAKTEFKAVIDKLAR